MKKINSMIILMMFSSLITAQEVFLLKDPDVKKIQNLTNESDYLEASIFTYLYMNYNNDSKKSNVKKEPNGVTECGYTKEFSYNILYTIQQCDEAPMLTEKVIFPKTELTSLKKWVELIYLSTETEISNVWYKDKIEYGPKNKEAGCYYSITQTESQSIIDIKCGS